MGTHHRTHRRRYLILPVAGAALVLSMEGTAAAANLASPSVLTVPAGCGTYSGTPIPATWTVNDHSGDTTALGSPSSYYQVPAHIGFNLPTLTIGTAYDDYIQGNGFNDIICAGDGRDVVNGGEGDDYLYGDTNVDVLSGENGGDFLGGGPGIDTLFGDDFGQTHPTDGVDTLQGADANDWLYGGAGLDIINGGNGKSDYADGQGGGATCTDTETGPC